MAARARAGSALTMLAAFAAGLLSGCATPPPAGLSSQVAAAAPDAMLPAPRGPLALSIWEAERPRAVLLALHGYGDHAPATFETAAELWAARGITVLAYDQRGFGRNPSNRRWPGEEALIEDLEFAARWAHESRPDLPLFVLGHSMGGGVALAAAGEGRLTEARGLILLAPAVWGGAALNPMFRLSAWSMAHAAPDLRFSASASPIRLQPTDNIEMLIRLSSDPLRFANPSSREFMGLIRVMDRAVAAAAQDHLDTLVVMGAHDEIVPEASVRAAYETLPGPKRYIEAPEGWHMLLRDLQAEKVHALVADWLLERVE